jgi:phosphoribosyl 1,2-cyclic phosphate phosphodiesterase
VCSSDLERLRASLYIELEENEKKSHILIDTSPDLRLQALKYKIPKVNLILYTHAHADHIYGLDDVRIYNFIQKSHIPVYADELTSKALLRMFPYCFEKDPKYQGGGVPNLKLNTIKAGDSIEVGNSTVKSLLLYHGNMPILGYRIGNFAYLTDCSNIPNVTIEELKGVDTIILDGLRYRPHKTHFNIPQAIEFALKNSFKKTYLTHISHEIEHELVNKTLEVMTNNRVSLCYDGLEIVL